MLSVLRPKEVILNELFKVYSDSSSEDKQRLHNSNCITVNKDGKVFIHNVNTSPIYDCKTGSYITKCMYHMGIISYAYRKACINCTRKYTIKEFLDHVKTL